MAFMSRWGSRSLAILLAVGCADRNNADVRKAPDSPTAPGPAKAVAPDARAADLPPHTVYASAGEALRAILEAKPRVLGFGEFHALKGAPPVATPLRRFTDGMLDVLGPHLSDLVIETWISEGRCGRAEEKVTTDVPRQTERPPETETDLMRLAKRARELGAQPRAMVLSCRDYETLLAKGGDVDYEVMLSLITRELLRVSLEAVRERDEKKGSRPIVAVYGGAIHNDLMPHESTRQWSYASQLGEKSGGYVEVDLYVPEYVEGNDLLSREPWYPLLAEARPGRVLLVRRTPRSFILILEKGLAEGPTGSERRSP